MKLNILALVVAAGFMSNAFAVATEAGKGQSNSQVQSLKRLVQLPQAPLTRTLSWVRFLQLL